MAGRENMSVRLFLNEVLSLNAQEFVILIPAPLLSWLLNEVLSLNAQESGEENKYLLPDEAPQ